MDTQMLQGVRRHGVFYSTLNFINPKLGFVWETLTKLLKMQKNVGSSKRPVDRCKIFKTQLRVVNFLILGFRVLNLRGTIKGKTLILRRSA